MFVALLRKRDKQRLGLRDSELAVSKRRHSVALDVVLLNKVDFARREGTGERALHHIVLGQLFKVVGQAAQHPIVQHLTRKTTCTKKPKKNLKTAVLAHCCNVRRRHDQHSWQLPCQRKQSPNRSARPRKQSSPTRPRCASNSCHLQ
jgi:hypothetical protein